MKVILSLIISLIFLLGLVGGMFVFYVSSSPDYQKNNLSNPFLQNITTDNSTITKVQEEIIINEEHVTYLLNEMGAYNLKSCLSDTPKIKVEVDNEKFGSEIIQGEIKTKKGEIENSDINIITSKEEVIKIASSANPKEYIKESVSSGETRIEMIAGYSKLFAKGYLDLYTQITGKSLTGSAIKIFSN